MFEDERIIPVDPLLLSVTEVTIAAIIPAVAIIQQQQQNRIISKALLLLFLCSAIAG
jgi:hypothetical protein